MMKKLILISSLLALGISTTANAKPLMCPFTDYFNISAPSGNSILDLFTEGNISATIRDYLHFTTSCKDNNNSDSGYAYLTFGDSVQGCGLVILDGPYQNNPEVVFQTCLGNLKYTGMDHDWGTYTYKLKFSY